MTRSQTMHINGLQRMTQCGRMKTTKIYRLQIKGLVVLRWNQFLV